jgi:AcrR family transcriptional regulator
LEINIFTNSREENVKNRLYRTALKLFATKGYAATSVNDIVKLADCSKGTFYHYYQSKDDLLFLIHDEFITYELNLVKEVEKNKEFTCHEKLRRMISIIWDSIDKYKDNVAIFFQEIRFIQGEKFELISKKRKDLEKSFVSVLREGINNGDFKLEVNPKMIVFGIFGMSHWGIYWFRPEGSLTVQEIADNYTNLILSGISNISK